MPEVTVSVKPYDREGSNIKVLACVVLDNYFVINNVTVLESKSGNDFVAMPGYKTNQMISRERMYLVRSDIRPQQNFVRGYLMKYLVIVIKILRKMYHKEKKNRMIWIKWFLNRFR